MSVWERLYDEETLNKAKTVKFNNLKIKHDTITAQIAGTKYEITSRLVYKSPYDTKCSCDKQVRCEHDAALHYHIDNHPEILNANKDCSKIMENVDADELKEFVLEELKRNITLNHEFIVRFESKTAIDKEKYYQSLAKAIRSGEGHDFYLHQLYDIGKMEKALTHFMKHDIDEILESGEYSFACEILCKIADVLDDELETIDDSWYNLTKTFSEIACPLLESIFLDFDEIEEL